MLEKSKIFLEKNLDNFSEKDVLELQKILEYHSDLYHNKQSPIISDKDYDDLLKKLQFLEEKFSLEKKFWGQVWAEVKESTFAKVKHSRPMISLDNTYNEKDLRDFDERVMKLVSNNSFLVLKNIEYCLEFKFDWLWVELIYKNWEFVQAITRWNWILWEDVTENVKKIKNIPKKISYLWDLEVRWEVIMPISSFEKLNKDAIKNWEKVFSNPRNAASWSLRTLDTNLTEKRNLKFFAYDLWEFKQDFFLFYIWKSYAYFSVIKYLETLWFEISSYFKICNWIEEVIKNIENFWNTKKEIDFDIDWLVLKVNDIHLWETIWKTEHHPRYAIAYKFPAEIFTSKIISVEHSVWRTGTITPVANLEPVIIWWVTVKRATLHNYEEVENLGVNIWDYVFLKRAWEVIPKIISVVSSSQEENKLEKILPPEFCPSCNTKIQKDEDKVRYYCPNSVDCPAQKSEKLAFAVGKQWFNIDWLWEKQVELFLNFWIIHNIVDVFKISSKKEKILELEWFKEKSVSNLISSVSEAKKTDLKKFITALWISGVGKKTAKTLEKYILSLSFEKFNLEIFLKAFENIEILISLPDIWPEIAKNLVEYFSNDAHKKIIKDLFEVLEFDNSTSTQAHPNPLLRGERMAQNKFFWKKVCITGSFEWYSRDELVEILEKSWWEFVSSVSKNTNFLLAWEKAWSKLQKANLLWISVISLEEFLKNI